MFPKLDALHLPLDGVIEDPHDSLVDEYESNMQKVINLGVHHRRLRVLEGTVFELAFGGYICSVEKLILKSKNLDWDYDGVSRLILQTRPSTLHVSIQVEEPTRSVIPIIQKVMLLGPFKELLISLDFMYRNDPILRSVMVSTLT